MTKAIPDRLASFFSSLKPQGISRKDSGTEAPEESSYEAKRRNLKNLSIPFGLGSTLLLLTTAGTAAPPIIIRPYQEILKDFNSSIVYEPNSNVIVIMHDFPEMRDESGMPVYQKHTDFNNNTQMDPFEPLGHRHLHYIGLNQNKIKPQVLAIDAEAFAKKYPDSNPLSLEIQLKWLEEITAYVKEYKGKDPIIVSSSIPVGHAEYPEDFSVFMYPFELNEISEGANIGNFDEEPHRSKILSFIKENRPSTYKTLMTVKSLVDALNEKNSEGKQKGFFVESVGNFNMVNLLPLVGAKLNGFTDKGIIAKENSEVKDSIDFLSNGRIDFRSSSERPDPNFNVSEVNIRVNDKPELNFQAGITDSSSSLIGVPAAVAQASPDDVKLAMEYMKFLHTHLSENKDSVDPVKPNKTAKYLENKVFTNEEAKAILSPYLSPMVYGNSDSDQIQIIFSEPGKIISIYDSIGVLLGKSIYDVDENGLLQISYKGSSFAKNPDDWIKYLEKR